MNKNPSLEDLDALYKKYISDPAEDRAKAQLLRWGQKLSEAATCTTHAPAPMLVPPVAVFTTGKS